ncbi:hypothetical protein [Engelhardtia mirabilis]|uniref:Ig-like domain-containing protein n=1 Tax=Engelhardtia mirabilis TaxID=2528011 RepID=A0A518BMY9_9BACT|nr:hypothetical protein Pla133_34460 [Planctomycetes bacterium Pla133]QDV02676.1 hypothetical protein Pla86_34450 [Planctomycetes bacterium Pla86]
MQAKSLVRLLFATALMAAPTAAQELPGSVTPLAPTGALSNSVGLSVVDDGLIGGAGSFEARFDPSGVTFVPVLGQQAPVEQTLTLSATSLRRVGASVDLKPVAPRAEGLVASYDRAEGVVERFEVTGEGLWHSVVLDRAPLGSGDLELRLTIGGVLRDRALGTADGGLEFDAGFGGVRYGALTGVDARGRTAPGSVRVEGTQLVLRLAADFVDSASYPMVLDPLIGTRFPVDSSTFDDAEPDVAWDASWGRFLVVWKRTFSAISSAIRGQVLIGDGTLDGGTVFFGSSGQVTRPQVANANYASTFVVVWRQTASGADSIRAQAFSPGVSGLTGVVPIAIGAAGSLSRPDVGGELLKVPFKQALVIWDRSGVGIEGVKLNVELDSTPTAVSAFTVATEVPLLSTVDSPSITRNAGNVGLYGVTYLRRASLIGGVSSVFAAVLDRDGTVVNPGQKITSAPSQEYEPEIEGGGVADSRWIVASSYEQTPGSGDYTVLLTPVVPGATTLTASPSQVLTQVAGAPRVALGWRPGKTYVAWRENGLFADALRVTGVDATTCLTCEASLLVEVLSAGDPTLALCTTASGGNYGEGRALLVWNEESVSPLSTDQDVQGQLLDAFTSTYSITDLGGGCGAGGTAVTPNPATIGNGYFQVLLQGASPLAPAAILNLSVTTAVPLACGPCLWVPFGTTFVQPVLGGGAGMVLAIPCNPALVAAQLDLQWTVLTPGSSPCALSPDVSVSNRMRLLLGS